MAGILTVSFVSSCIMDFIKDVYLLKIIKKFIDSPNILSYWIQLRDFFFFW